ncbi:hypothetical protein N320_06885, partial [Buceros rhinoceros silvestris]
IDVLLFENSDLLLLLRPLQRLMQPIIPKASVVFFKVDPLQDQPKSWGFGNIDLLLAPAALYDRLGSITFHNSYHQPNHLPYLVHHETLTFHFDHRKLYVLPDERLSTVHLHYVPLGTGVPGSLLRREVVEVVCSFIAREQFIDFLKGLSVQSINLFLHILVFVGKGKCWQHV